MNSLFENINSIKFRYSVALIIFLIPTYFIHSHKYPDWGDDFAQYVYQAQQIHSPTEPYKQVLNVNEYSSPKRSVFFSVILSVITPTLHIQNYVDLISVTYILSGLVIFLFFSSYYTLSVSFVGTLALCYNFLFLRLKSEVVPEFIFIVLFYGVLYLVYQNKKWGKYVIPVLLGLLVSVRFVGLALLLSYLCFLFLQKDKDTKSKLKLAGITLLIFGLTISVINGLFLSSIHNQEVTLYSNIVKNRFTPFYVFDNTLAYARYVLFFFEQEIPFWMNLIITFFALLFFVTGFSATVLKQKNILHFSFVFYVLFLIAYPSLTDIIKYLIPIIPLLFYFMIMGLKKTLERIKFKQQHIVIVVCLSILCLSNTKTVWLQHNRSNSDILPYNENILLDFEKIKQTVKQSENIAFGKPFIINLLADRNAYFLSNKNYEQVFEQADYVLSPKKTIKELFPKIEGIKMTKGDTLELENFYLVKL